MEIRFTSNVIVSEKGEVSKSACPVQIIFCLKEQNKKKLNRYVQNITGQSYLLCLNDMFLEVTAGFSTRSGLSSNQMVRVVY